jgi:hypothetical protein
MIDQLSNITMLFSLVVAPGWVLTPPTAGYMQMGGLEASDYIPMERVVGSFMRFVEDSSLKGTFHGFSCPL